MNGFKVSNTAKNSTARGERKDFQKDKKGIHEINNNRDEDDGDDQENDEGGEGDDDTKKQKAEYEM